jgi:DNA (cytosine-5)-methyltransferase 3A
MKVLSLFDGMSCGQIALRELGIIPEVYYASEIDRHAIAQTQLNFPDTVQLGDVQRWKDWDIDWDHIYLVMGGSPCQGFSFCGKQLAFDDPRSRLFFVFAEILDYARSRNPNVKFLLENVNMKKEYLNVISDRVGVRPVNINSTLVSAQNRNRWYWTDIRTRREGIFGEVFSDIPQPEDQGIFLQDILEKEVGDKYFLSEKAARYVLDEKRLGKKYTQINGEKSLTLTAKGTSNLTGTHILQSMDCVKKNTNKKHEILCLSSTQSHATVYVDKSTPMVAAAGCGGGHIPMIIQLNTSKESGGKQPYQQNRVYDPSGKSPALMADMSCGSHAVYQKTRIRRLTPTECARLQTILDWYRWGCSDTQQYRMLGNGWTVEVIKHILSFGEWVKI